MDAGNITIRFPLTITFWARFDSLESFPRYILELYNNKTRESLYVRGYDTEFSTGTYLDGKSNYRKNDAPIINEMDFYAI